MAKPKAINSLARSKKINMLLYSEPGVGKTRFIGTTPGKVLILRPPVDHTDSILDPSPGLEEWVLNDWADAFEALEYLRHDGGEYDWVWFDSISGWQEVGLDDLWATVLAEKPARARYGLDKQEYGINQFRLGGFIRHIVGAGLFNFGVTAHVWPKPVSLDPDADTKLMPLITGKTGGAEGGMAIKVCGYMNIVAYMSVTKKGTRLIKTQATEDYYAKDQFDALPEGKLLNPTMPKMVEAIEKARKGTTTTRRAATRRRSTTKG